MTPREWVGVDHSHPPANRRRLVLACTLASLLSPAIMLAANSFLDKASTSGLGTYRARAGDDHGPGAAFADLDNDGWDDLVLVTGTGEASAVYHNRPGTGGQRTFVKITLTSDPSCNPGSGTLGSTGAVVGDYDNDGDRDVYVINHPRNSPGVTFAPNVLYKNLFKESGSLTFQDVTCSTDPTPGVSDEQFGVSHGKRINFSGCPANEVGGLLDNSLTAAWADVDRDGDLDLYVGNHDGWAFNAEEAPKPGQRDILYKNELIETGSPKFRDITESVGATGFVTATGTCYTGSLANPDQVFSSTNAVIFGDFNNDRWPDLFVANKVGGPPDADMMYLNKKNSGSLWLGYENRTYIINPGSLAGDFGGVSGASMGVDAGDFDRDGDLDLYISDINGPSGGQNDLMTNTGATNIDFSWDGSSVMTADFSWGVDWVDVNNDGRLDMHVATAGGRADFLYIQNANGTFTNSAATWGVAQSVDSRGNPHADYDRDGDVDLFVVNLGNIPSKLWQNQLTASSSSRYLHIRLEGDPSLAPAPFRSSRDAIGAQVRVTTGSGAGAVTQLREVVSGSGNAASSSSLALEFGVGTATEADVEIRWPSGRTEVLANVLTNQFLALKEGQAASCRPTATALCLQSGRFEATLTSNTTVGQATPHPTATVSGFFWLFGAENIEVGVKVLDAGSTFWVFHGNATSQPYTLTVTDTKKGTVKVFQKTTTSLCGGTDFSTFPKAFRGPLRLTDDPAPEGQLGFLAKAGSCVATSTSVCLIGNRFRAEVLMSGVPQPAKWLTDKTGIYSFASGSPDNTELVVKVLDGTPVNGFYWVFFGSLTSQTYTVRVTDTMTSVVKTYASPAALCGNADTTAFPAP